MTANEKYADDLLERVWDKITNSHTDREKTLVLMITATLFITAYAGLDIESWDSEIEDQFDSGQTNYLRWLVENCSDSILSQLDKALDRLDMDDATFASLRSIFE